MEIAAVLPLLWILFAIVAALIGSPKGQGVLGFILGLLFGPLGVLIMLFTKGSKRECPYCKELVKQNATVCAHCQKEITPATREQQWDQRASKKLLKSDLKKLPELYNKPRPPSKKD